MIQIGCSQLTSTIWCRRWRHQATILPGLRLARRIVMEHCNLRARQVRLPRRRRSFRWDICVFPIPKSDRVRVENTMQRQKSSWSRSKSRCTHWMLPRDAEEDPSDLGPVLLFVEITGGGSWFGGKVIRGGPRGVTILIGLNDELYAHKSLKQGWNYLSSVRMKFFHHPFPVDIQVCAWLLLRDASRRQSIALSQGFVFSS